MKLAEQLLLDLSNPDLRENALLELSKEILSIYHVLSPPNLTPAQSNSVRNALALLQHVASHPGTRMSFLNEEEAFPRFGPFDVELNWYYRCTLTAKLSREHLNELFIGVTEEFKWS
ncbi:CCR4-NOT transcription complex subunit 9 isoform X2 [Capsicum annuum]|uniref:CCR4-NOT transcription complex subunit 9 isoform X2 n=1 Tax=Capsicum annuum TaxID=4072 RepID=UPI0007BF7110|nr:CCR4-NOT transcription complex subunit 9 isoform X2 [Capsicum annuum]